MRVRAFSLTEFKRPVPNPAAFLLVTEPYGGRSLTTVFFFYGPTSRPRQTMPA